MKVSSVVVYFSVLRTTARVLPTILGLTNLYTCSNILTDIYDFLLQVFRPGCDAGYKFCINACINETHVCALDALTEDVDCQDSAVWNYGVGSCTDSVTPPDVPHYKYLWESSDLIVCTLIFICIFKFTI